MFGVSPWHRWLPTLTGTNKLARASLLVKGSREHSRDAKVLGLVEHAQFMTAEELGGGQKMYVHSDAKTNQLGMIEEFVHFERVPGTMYNLMVHTFVSE